MRIFDRPDLDQRAARLAMYITGSFANGQPAEAYEGRLQVHNGVGGMTVEQIDGDKLPNGTSLYMDGAEVVLSWPAFSATAAVIPNPGFESGDVSWTKGTGWSIGTENPIAGARSARYGENPGDALIENTARYPVNPGMPIEATCQVRQGASAEGNAGAAVQLQWRREDGSLLETSEGNAVMSASKNRVYPSTVVAAPPAGAALVNVASRGIRKRENKPLFIDSFVWDHQQLTGVNASITYNLMLRVRDSSGQSSIWSGVVVVADFFDTRWAIIIGQNLYVAENSDSFGEAASYFIGLNPGGYDQIQANDQIRVVNKVGTGSATYYSDGPDWNPKGVQGPATTSGLALATRYIISGNQSDRVQNRVDTATGVLDYQIFTGGGGSYGDESVLMQCNGTNNYYSNSFSFDSGITWMFADEVLNFPATTAGVGNRAVTAVGGTRDGVFRSQFRGRRNTGVLDFVTFPTSAEVVDMAYCDSGWVAVFADNSVITRAWDRSEGWVAKTPVPTAGMVRGVAANSRYIVVCTSEGELFRSTNFATSWSKLDIGALAGDVKAVRVWGAQTASREVFPVPPAGVEVFNRTFTDESVEGLTGFGPSVALSSTASGLELAGTVSGNAVRVRLDEMIELTDFEAEYDFLAPESGINGGLIYRNGQWLDANDTYGYLVAVEAGQVVLGRGTAGGSYSAVSSGGIAAVPAGTLRHARVLVQAERHRVWIDGTLALDYKSSVYLDTASKLGFNRFKNGAATSMTFRNLVIKTA